MSDMGNGEQTRIVAEQVAETAITRFAQQHPEIRRNLMEIPAPLKWASAIIAGIFTIGTGALALWLVSTVSNMQVTLARMDERMAAQDTAQGGEMDDLRRRVADLETYHRQDRNER